MKLAAFPRISGIRIGPYHRIHPVLLVVGLLVAAASTAQPFVFEPISLDDGWRFRPGDDLRWADPDYDDSSWPRIEVPGPWGHQGFEAVELGWYRLTVSPIPDALADPSGHLGIHMGPVVSGYRLYAGGTEIGGPFGPPWLEHDRHHIFPVPPGAVRDGRLVLAIRVHRHAAFGTGAGGLQGVAPRLGRLDDLARWESRDAAPMLALASACGLVGLLTLVLAFGRRRPAESLWLGLLIIDAVLVVLFDSPHAFLFGSALDGIGAAEPIVRCLLPALWLQWLTVLFAETFRDRKRRLAVRLYQGGCVLWGLAPLALGVDFAFASVSWWIAWTVPVLALSALLLIRPPDPELSKGTRIAIGVALLALGLDVAAGLDGLNRPLLSHLGLMAPAIAWLYRQELRLRAARERTEELESTFDQRIEAATVELRQELEEAQSLSRSRIEFLANVSHEIRTPMMGILGVGDLLRKCDLGFKERGYTETIRSSALALLGVLNDILDYSKIEAGHLTLQAEAFELREAVRGVVELLEPKAREKNIELTHEVWPEAPEWVSADPWRLRQVLINLVGNAIKFTQDGKVILEVLPARQAAGSKDLVLRFAVIDTGVGVAPQELPRLFDAFTQAGSGSQRLAGTGLGLAISRRIVESMGGHIGADSQIGEGSNFWFEVPLRVVDEPSSAPTLSGAVAAFREGRVLLAEDNEVNRMVVLGQLESLGVQAEAVHNGAEALEAVASSRYDLVLMDCQMPHMDGYEATRRLREQESHRDLPIIAITAHAFEGDRERCIEAGMNDYLVKPFEEEQLASILDRWMHPAGDVKPAVAR